MKNLEENEDIMWYEDGVEWEIKKAEEALSSPWKCT